MNVEQAHFCGKCGTSLEGGHRLFKDAADSQGFNATATLEKATAKTKHLWLHFMLGEKIMAVGAIVVLISFFMPWMSVGLQSANGISVGQSFWYIYLIPLSAVFSIILLPLSQEAGWQKKVLLSRWQIVIGAVWATVSLLAIVSINKIMSAIQAMTSGFGGMFGAPQTPSAGVGFGLYLIALGSLALIIGAFILQKEALLKNQ